MRYITTTKNLFDISKVPTISGSLIVKDNSICSYAYPAVTNDTNILSIFKSLKPNTNYTMSATTLNYLGASTNYIVLIFSNANEYNIFYNFSAGFNKVTFSLTQEQINNITHVYFYGRDESSGGPTMWSNIQLEEGSTATPYVPYGYLPMYKGRYKVSDVCQLLDKSEYPSAITGAGVTTTSNGDGSITINGTATKSWYVNCTPPYPKENNGHVFYVCANNTAMSSSTWYYGLLNQGEVYDYGNGVIGRTNASGLRNTGITFNKGVVFDNVIIKPQIIDLTEMYGAGNEPKTVEEFREKFPDELYPYSPYCWAKIKSLIYKDDIEYIKIK